MSGRSVAEIIGCHLAPSRTFGDYAWYDRQGRRVGGEGWTPDVDFLLAWLGQQPYSVWLHPKGASGRSLPAGEPIAVTVCRVAADGSMEAPLHDHPAPTLLAALEAAVRAVAGEDE